MDSQFTKKIIVSMVLFFVTYPLSACKSLSSNNTTVTLSASAIKKLKDIINLKEKANVLKDCNTTKSKVLAEIIKTYKNINMSKNGVRKVTRLRIKDLVREKNIVGSFTKSSTNQRKQRISFKNGQFLSLDKSGKINGTSVKDGNINRNTIFYVKTKAPQVIMVQSLQTKKFVAMDKHGHIYAKTKPDHDTLFYLRTEENNFLTLASYKYYLLCPYDMFLAIRNTGYMKSPHQSVPGQDSTQLLFVPVK